MAADERTFVNPSFYRQLAELLEAGTATVVVTVTGARGSVPGKMGAKMLVTARGHDGTVGGGKIEKAAIDDARSMLGGDGETETKRYDLNRDLGMTCGGSVELLFEPQRTAPRLVLFGAGHIAEPLASFASRSGFAVTVCDARSDWLTRERFPTAARLILAEPKEAVAEAKIDGDTFVASVSPGHAVDVDVLTTLFASGASPRYVGVIGSRRKGIVLKERLRELGVDGGAVDAVRIPIGLNIGATGPTEIALSIVAELVQSLRGADATAGW